MQIENHKEEVPFAFYEDKFRSLDPASVLERLSAVKYENGEFTVNIPLGDYDSKILGYCGTKSRRDTDKIADLGLTLEESVNISVPGIKELPLTLECKVIYKQMQDLSAVPEEILKRYYPEYEEYCFAGDNRDFHYAYYGEIVGAYIVE